MFSCKRGLKLIVNGRTEKRNDRKPSIYFTRINFVSRPAVAALHPQLSHICAFIQHNNKHSYDGGGGDDHDAIVNTQISHCPRLWIRFRYILFFSTRLSMRLAPPLYTLLRPIVFFFFFFSCRFCIIILLSVRAAYVNYYCKNECKEWNARDEEKKLKQTAHFTVMRIPPRSPRSESQLIERM